MVNEESSHYCELTDKQVLSYHSGLVNTFKVTSNCKYLISGGDDTTIKIYSLETNSVINTLYGHEKRVNSIAVSIDDKVMVSGSDDRTVRIWNLDSFKLVHTLSQLPSEIQKVVFSHNGLMLLAYDSANLIYVFSSSNYQVIS